MSASSKKIQASRRGVRQWRIDLKWITGIPFTLVLALTILIFSLFRVTGAGNAVDSLKAMNAPVLADTGLQQEIAVRAPALAAFLSHPDFAETVYNDPGTLDQMIDTLPGEGVALGPEGSTEGEVAASEEESAEAASQNGFKSTVSFYKAPLAVFNAGTHETMGQALTVSLVMLLVTGIPFILLSRRAGRFLSPGISLAVAAWGPLLIVHSMKGSLDEKIVATQAAATGKQEILLMGIVRPLSDGVMGQFLGTYRFFAIMAVALMFLSALLLLARKGVERYRHHRVQLQPPAVA